MKIIVDISTEEVLEILNKKEPQNTETLLNNVSHLKSMFQSQSCDEVVLGHPYEVQIPVKDLVELYVARAARENHQVGSHRT